MPGVDQRALAEQIRRAFSEVPPPSPDDLVNTHDGEEPYLLEDEFHHVPAWTELEAELLDESPAGYGTALGLFSTAAFRYYLPAFLLADLEQALDRVDPAVHLWRGFDDTLRDEPVHARALGGWTWFDAMALRFESFTLDEAEAIVSYLKFRAERDPEWRRKIGESLRNYWNPRLLHLARRPR